MLEVTPTLVVAAVSLAGAAGQAAVTVRWYEPPTIDEREPNPAFEAGIFYLVFAVAFAVLGLVLSSLAGAFPPYSRFLPLVLVPFGAFTVYAAATGRFDGRATRAQIGMGAVCGLVLIVYPIAFLVV
ncbi:hypothetical protein [Natronobiforma cellulositropha]|uniref:hypothetical protein n=1 Tax=Natronobiforma cellulositropha TaxID=1679076 RepID=UPI0021D5CDF5|nr:hypothetical protein [Natronobiforma cellulositropha]